MSFRETLLHRHSGAWRMTYVVGSVRWMVAMSDFQDFLKRQYAYVARGEFQPGKFAEVRQLYEAAIATYKEGFKGAYLLREPGTEQGISIIFWESIEEMEASHSPEYQALLGKMAPLFASGPSTTLYELEGEYFPPDVNA